MDRVAPEGAGQSPEPYPPPEHHNLVFDRAFRVSQTRATEDSSNGLGLAICKSLIEAQGGQIGVVSDGLGLGASFWFRLPAVTQLAPD